MHIATWRRPHHSTARHLSPILLPGTHRAAADPAPPVPPPHQSLEAPRPHGCRTAAAARLLPSWLQQVQSRGRLPPAAAVGECGGPGDGEWAAVRPCVCLKQQEREIWLRQQTCGNGSTTARSALWQLLGGCIGRKHCCCGRRAGERHAAACQAAMQRHAQLQHHARQVKHQNARYGTNQAGASATVRLPCSQTSREAARASWAQTTAGRTSRLRFFFLSASRAAAAAARPSGVPSSAGADMAVSPAAAAGGGWEQGAHSTSASGSGGRQRRRCKARRPVSARCTWSPLRSLTYKLSWMRCKLPAGGARLKVARQVVGSVAI